MENQDLRRVGIVIGAAFGKIVASFVADVLMPPIGVLLGNVNFAELAITLKEEVLLGEIRDILKQQEV